MNRSRQVFQTAGVVLISFLAGFWYHSRTGGPASSSASERRVLYWHDPMHPAYRSDKPGIAPDCGMQLEPVYAGQAAAPALGGVEVKRGPRRALGIRVGAAERSSGASTLRLLGRVAVDETKIYRVFAFLEGFIRDVSPHAAGNLVRKDELLAAYFTRDVLTAQQAYIYALNTRDRFEASGEKNDAQEAVTAQQVRSAADALLGYGVSEAQMRELARSRRSLPLVEVRSPAQAVVISRSVALNQRVERGAELYRLADIGKVWVLADVYEREAGYLKAGAAVRVRYQDHVLPARISDALSQFDPASRTLKVRLEMDNAGYLLRPDMFVDVELPVRLPPAVTVPADAVIDSGLRKTVYVEEADGEFEPRPVETGWRFGDRVAITRGLETGERVVVSGTFLIDSETRMRQADADRKDPVCGMRVDPDNAVKAERRGQTRYFCGEHCKREFEKNPERYLGSS
jgi:RND family efflux transporter MFP subunit